MTKQTRNIVTPAAIALSLLLFIAATKISDQPRASSANLDDLIPATQGYVDPGHPGTTRDITPAQILALGGGPTGSTGNRDNALLCANGTGGSTLKQCDESGDSLIGTDFDVNTTYKTVTFSLGTRLCWGNQANKDVATLCIGKNTDDSLGIIGGSFNNAFGTNGVGTQEVTDTLPSTCTAGSGRSVVDDGTSKRACFCLATDSWFCAVLTPA